ncbi:N-acetylneuraminate synthase family protein [Acetobacterium carbinolicum]|uniref:N-acetylneuraminate synthase family protein n=1 Tax=Acetobacterium carbinolicum TaxID=52690 RepID=UPI0039BFC1D8
MKIALGTVIYKTSYKYYKDYVVAINNQSTKDFDVLLLNDDLSREQCDVLSNALDNKVELVNSKLNSTIPELRIDLIRVALEKNYDILVLTDFDDTISKNRISEIESNFDPIYSFFYNDLYYMGSGDRFFCNLPVIINEINPIMETNFLGLSNTALNLNKISFKMLSMFKNMQTEAFDWMIFSLLLLYGHMGKKIKNCKTYYRIHDKNIAGDFDDSIQGLKKEIEIKIDHYSNLLNIDFRYSELYKFYFELNLSFDKYSDKLLSNLTTNNQYWWGSINRKIFEGVNLVRFNYKKIKNYGKPYIIAEIGANHNGDMNLAKKMVDSAVDCGADAVKFQSWSNRSLISQTEYEKNQEYDDSPKKHFGSLKEMVDKYYLREEQHYLLKKYCDKKNIDFCSTPFSEDEVDLLEKLDVKFFKVASMDINNLRLLEYIAYKGKPIILSTGMSTLSEIETAVRTIEAVGNREIIILHCISIYPPEGKDIHLNNITSLQKIFPGYPIGFSDHTIGVSVPIASVALGAAIIEKHFTTDKDLPGWDHEVSAEPEEMKFIVEQSKIVNEALGSFERTVSTAEQIKKLKFRRSIVLTKNLKVGERINKEDITFKRPGTHIRPDEEKYVIGRKVNRDMIEDEILDWGDLI